MGIFTIFNSNILKGHPFELNELCKLAIWSLNQVANLFLIALLFYHITIVSEISGALLPRAAAQSSARNPALGGKHVTNDRCEPITIQLCANIQYNRTIMPNLLGKYWIAFTNILCKPVSK